ncbi:hypothetical protein [Methanobrevibacter sp.]|jgi:hypothetical protein|uniref:hypothetical protein n=1 Tax=Methanobrevibacter sp. TaxID=66852 RepID=UPI0025DC33D1|nr:hypothetical protein [Methanobrevibacter sp.]
MVLENYDVKEDDFFITLCDGKNLSIASQKKYANALKNYTNFNKLTLGQLLDEADKDEDNNIRLARRKIRSRLINFRTHLINDLGYKASTIKTNMICAKAFYRFHGIEIPEIPNAVLTKSPNDSIDFDDLPTINDIKTAIESTKLNKHKALFLFAACNGAARMELTNFTFGQFLEGVAPYCNKPETPQDIINDLDGKCEELEVIPVFKMKRQKTDYYYYAPITPECTQFCLNYLKAEGLGLKPEDPFFQLSKDGVSTAFKLINEKFNWGKRGLYGFFSSHRVRKFNASAIEDTNFANYIQGRKPDPIKETYFKKDINRVRDEYKKHMHKFTLYAHYDVMINSEAYSQLQNQMADERIQHANEVADLKQQMEDKDIKHKKEIDNLKSSMDTQFEDMQKQMEDLRVTPSRKTKSDIEKAINTYCKNNINEDDMQKDYVIRNFALDLALENKKDFENTDDYIAPLIKKAKIKISLSGKTYEELFNQIMEKNDEEYVGNKEMTNAVREVMKTMTSNTELMEIISDENYYELQDAIETYLKKSDYDITNLSDSDKTEIVSEVLMEFV